MMEARTSHFDKDEAPMTECRPYKNQKSQFLKNEKSGLWNFRFLNPDRFLAPKKILNRMTGFKRFTGTPYTQRTGGQGSFPFIF
jgi:hypothetical protein